MHICELLAMNLKYYRKNYNLSQEKFAEVLGTTLSYLNQIENKKVDVKSSTIDKFAQVALREETYSLFGRSGSNIPPELIIQDELHLISGPLGTIAGIYEAAFQKMFMYSGISAKIIASTATMHIAP